MSVRRVARLTIAGDSLNLFLGGREFPPRTLFRGNLDIVPAEA